MDTIRGLANQGLLGFYKGSFWGIMYNLSNSAFRFYGMEALEKLNLPFYTEGNAVTRGVSGKTQVLLINSFNFWWF